MSENGSIIDIYQNKRRADDLQITVKPLPVVDWWISAKHLDALKSKIALPREQRSAIEFSLHKSNGQELPFAFHVWRMEQDISSATIHVHVVDRPDEYEQVTTRICL